MAHSSAPDRSPARSQPRSPAAAGPVVLATLGVRVDPRAEQFACAAALEVGASLIIASMLELQPFPLTFTRASTRRCPMRRISTLSAQPRRGQRRVAFRPSCCGSRARAR